jgi:hypothetical protein
MVVFLAAKTAGGPASRLFRNSAAIPLPDAKIPLSRRLAFGS